MNISAPFIVQVPPFFETLNKALEHVDILFGNESEAVAYAEAAGIEVRALGVLATRGAVCVSDLLS